MSAATLPVHFEERSEPGGNVSAVLAILVHVVLFGVLFLGVRWHSRPPETISVELYVPPPPPAPVQRVEAPPEPVVRPEPPPPPKPEPRIEPPKPDIALKAKPEPPKPKPKPEPPKKVEPPKPKPEPPKPKPEAVKPKPEPVKPVVPAKPRDDEMQKQLRAELDREQNALKVDRERQDIKDRLARDQAAERQRGLAAYIAKIRASIRGRIVIPPDINGNPEAVFEVTQLPTGQILEPIRLKRSSGHKAYDQAVERAILGASPLPKPDRPELFERVLELKFRPKEP